MIECDGDKWSFVISEDAQVDDAVDALKGVMGTLADHPNVDPMSFQGALMSAMMQSGSDAS